MLVCLGPNVRNLVPNNTCWPQNFRLTLWFFFGPFPGKTGPLQVLDLTTLCTVRETILFHILTNRLQIFTKFLYFEGFRSQNYVRILRVSQLM